MLKITFKQGKSNKTNLIGITTNKKESAKAKKMNGYLLTTMGAYNNTFLALGNTYTKNYSEAHIFNFSRCCYSGQGGWHG